MFIHFPLIFHSFSIRELFIHFPLVNWKHLSTDQSFSVQWCWFLNHCFRTSSQTQLAPELFSSRWLCAYQLTLLHLCFSQLSMIYVCTWPSTGQCMAVRLTLTLFHYHHHHHLLQSAVQVLLCAWICFCMIDLASCTWLLQACIHTLCTSTRNLIPLLLIL